MVVIMMLFKLANLGRHTSLIPGPVGWACRTGLSKVVTWVGTPVLDGSYPWVLTEEACCLLTWTLLSVGYVPAQHGSWLPPEQTVDASQPGEAAFPELATHHHVCCILSLDACP